MQRSLSRPRTLSGCLGLGPLALQLQSQIRELTDKGNLVSDDIIFEMMWKKIQASNTKKGYLLDGFPRRVTQAGLCYLYDCLKRDQTGAKDPKTCH